MRDIHRMPLPHRRRGLAMVASTCVIGSMLAACTVGGSSASGSADKGTLNIAMWTNPPAVDFVKKLDAEFEKQHPGVKVELKTAPTANNGWGTLFNSLLSAKSVDVLADYPRMPGAWPPPSTGIAAGSWNGMITSGQLTDLSKQPFMKNYDPALERAAMGYNGGVYGVLAAAYSHGVWYKKDLLAKYHLQVPTTFNEYLNDLKTFKSHGITPIFVAGKDDLQGAEYSSCVQQSLMKGQSPAQAADVGKQRAQAFWNGSQSWSDAIYQTCAQQYVQAMKYVEPAATGVSQLTAPGVWAAKADDFPFLEDGSWDGSTIAQANPKLKFGFFVPPGTNDAATNRNIISPDLTWEIPTWTKHKSLALDWLKLFSTQTNYQKWLQATGSVSIQPGQAAHGLPWMDWLNANQANAFASLQGPWIPTGAATDAAGPDLTKMVPFGHQAVKAALTSA
ncbi:MAG: extracellular solute-binding protein, partial [Mycobacterium sp.]|nr:extracellular solute-binding protein [Mycobacterium sp.]